jgi:hypothetical protein
LTIRATRHANPGEADTAIERRGELIARDQATQRQTPQRQTTQRMTNEGSNGGVPHTAGENTFDQRLPGSGMVAKGECGPDLTGRYQDGSRLLSDGGPDFQFRVIRQVDSNWTRAGRRGADRCAANQQGDVGANARPAGTVDQANGDAAPCEAFRWHLTANPYDQRWIITYEAALSLAAVRANDRTGSGDAGRLMKKAADERVREDRGDVEDVVTADAATFDVQALIAFE